MMLRTLMTMRYLGWFFGVLWKGFYWMMKGVWMFTWWSMLITLLGFKWAMILIYKTFKWSFDVCRIGYLKLKERFTKE